VSRILGAGVLADGAAYVVTKAGWIRRFDLNGDAHAGPRLAKLLDDCFSNIAHVSQKPHKFKAHPTVEARRLARPYRRPFVAAMARSTVS
jgi:hypothetical protein